MSIKVEVCIDNYASAEAACYAGANRLELCSSLVEGGLTPSFGMVERIKKDLPIEIFVMLRPRSGDFLYSSTEFEIIKSDLILFKNLGVHGFVIGSLKADGSIDLEKIGNIVELAKPLPVTFHRAIDMCVDPIMAVDALLQIGVKRILTSGGETTALLGKSTIRNMVNAAQGRLEIMAGSGVNPENVADIIDFAGVKEIHFSASNWVDGKMGFRTKGLNIGDNHDDYGNRVANTEAIRKMLATIKRFD